MVPGTKMSFAGLPRAEDRINLIAFLRTNTDSPVAIPAPAPAVAAQACWRQACRRRQDRLLRSRRGWRGQGCGARQPSRQILPTAG